MFGKNKEANNNKGIWALIFIGVTFLCFYGIPFLKGQQFARMGLAYNVDAFFNSSLKQAIVPFTCDPCSFLIWFPNAFFAQRSWLNFEPPLWNPYSGCGYPILGDPQSIIFYPALLLGSATSPQMFNLCMILEILTGTLGIYFLARFLRLSAAASVFAATAYEFCPFIVPYMDLRIIGPLSPWLFLVFARFGEKPNLRTMAVAVLVSAVSILTTHPEISFFAVLYSAFLGALLMFSQELAQGRKILVSAGKTIAYFAAAGALVGALSAPIILPFVEFLRSCYLYKESTGAAFFSYGDFINGFLNGKGIQPYYLGIMVAALLPLSLLIRSRTLICINIALLVIGFLSMPPSWLTPLMSHPPLSFVATIYGVPDLLVVLCLSSAFVVDHMAKTKSWLFVALLAVSTLFVLSIPLQGSADPVLVLKSDKIFYIYAGLSAAVALIFAVARQLITKIPAKTLACVFIAANIVSIIPFARAALPKCQPYRVEDNKAVQFLRSSGERTVSIGRNFFLPNLQMNYDVRALGCFSPMLLKPYRLFIQHCNTYCHNLYFYDFPETCSNLLDIASVKYLLTRTAIGDQQKPKSAETLAAVVPRRVALGLRIISADCFYDPDNFQFQGELKLRLHDAASLRYALQFCAYDDQGKILWQGPEELLDATGLSDHLYTRKYYVPVPVTKTRQSAVNCGFHLIDTWTSKKIIPDNKVVPAPYDICFLGKHKPAPPAVTHGADHFKLISENDGVRIYENTHALPQAYLVSTLRSLSNEEEALALLASPDFDPNEEAIIIDSQNKTEVLGRTAGGLVRVTRPRVTTVQADVLAPGPAMLVLTDSYYPGWKCKIDGNNAAIERVNYMFRGVRMPAGKHKVVFSYEPDSFRIGLILACSALLGLAVLLVFAARRKQIR